MEYKNESFITDLADGYSDEIFNETKEAYAKAKAFDEIVPFIREQFVRVNQSYGFAKFYGYSDENIKQAEEELLKIHQVAITVCNVLGITTEEFIMMEVKYDT